MNKFMKDRGEPGALVGFALIFFLLTFWTTVVFALMAYFVR